MHSESTRMGRSSPSWLITVLAFVFVATPAAQATVLCANTAVTEWTTAAGGNGHSYQAACGALTWTQASAAAVEAGGHLATIQSSAENDFVFGLIDDAGFWATVEGGFNLGPWIGGFQPPGSAEPNDAWSWVTGETFGFTHWMSNEPNNFNGLEEDNILFFAVTAPNRGSDWNDTEGSELAAYVIEWDHSLDVDASGEVAPLTDGLLVLRRLFGFGGATLIGGAVDLVNCSRCTAPPIETFLDGSVAGPAYDVREDWSDAANPNGPWSYREGTDALAHVAAWDSNSGLYPSPQPAWAASENGTDRIPAFMKSVGSEQFTRDFVAGDIVIHSRDDTNGVGQGDARLRFTAPANGVYQLGLGVWIGREIGRSVNWALFVDDVEQDSGNVASGDGFSRSSPDRYAASVALATGATVELRLTTQSTFGDLVGTRLRLDGFNLDVDGDGETLPLTDGLLVLRHLFGFTGNSLIAGAVDLVNCARCDGPSISAFLNGYD